jgi:hypothetical protein
LSKAAIVEIVKIFLFAAPGTKQPKTAVMLMNYMDFCDRPGISTAMILEWCSAFITTAPEQL